MKAQRLDLDVSRLLQGTPYPSAVTRPASETGITEGLRRKLQQRFPHQSVHIEHRLNWFIGLYLASLFSFTGLIAAVRGLLELL